MVFLPGDHVLDANITVAKVTRLTMHGESSSDNRATVVCSGSVGLSFTSMAEFKIDTLAFTSCSKKYATIQNTNLAIIQVVLYLHSTQDAELVNCSFHDNPGTALRVDNTNINLVGNTEFMHNYMLCEGNLVGGGGIIALSSTLTFTGNTTFLDNSASCSVAGGAIYTLGSTVSFKGINNFINNSASGDGGAIFTYNTILQFSGTNNFIKNSAENGGALFINNTIVSLSGTNSFIINSARHGGGAIFILGNNLNFNGINNFINNSAAQSGGAIFTNHTALTFRGTSNFINNSANWKGGAISAYDNNVLNFCGTSNFINNSANGGGAISTNANCSLTFNGTIHFTKNGHYWGAGTSGGGVYMGIHSTISMLPNTTLHWENNCAQVGGAIYVQDASPTSYCTPLVPYVPKEECFFQLPGWNLSSATDVQLVFKNNSADVAGSVLYGGAIDNCKLTHGLDSHSSGEVFDMIVHSNDTYYNRTSNISTDPIQICPCENNLPDCTKHQVSHTVYPVETFQLYVVAVGQRNGTVPSEVINDIDNRVNLGHLPDSQYLQKTKITCTQLNYTVFSLSQFVSMRLYAAHSPCSSIIDYRLIISVKLNQTCPPGFNISKSTRSCVCDPKLQKYTNSCTITNGLGQITRDSSQQFWVGYDSQFDELILHPHCPFDYCVNDTVVFPLNNTDTQCAYNRSGLLCGKCKKNYSFALGTSHCKQCTNSHLFLLIPFAIMGVALVFLLLVCKLTVATGMLNGLVFYANIVGVNRTIFLPVETTDVFSLFIAWLNLDFGIETCFYNGMDTYSKTWLQFVFPVYIWALVGLMILVSNLSQRFAKLLGNNPVSVLATLILLSYTKMLRTLITVFYITFLEYPAYNRMVWLYDANIDYLSEEHTPLFVVAVLIFIFLFLPYTLLLLFGQWLQAISHLRLFSWVNSARLKAFMDSYHAPYKAKHRYWPGLLLVLRFVLLLVFAFNLEEDHSINMLVVLVGTVFLVACAWLSGGVYRNWCLDALECSFALNMIILVGATFYVNHSHRNQLVVGYTSASIAFATFTCILAFQLANVTGITRYLNRKCPSFQKTIQNPQETESELRSPTGSLPDRLINPDDYEPSLYIPQGHAEATEGANEAQRGLITPVYTYGSIN